jgi:hypothetical protein
MRNMTDEDIKTMLSQVNVPAHSPDLPDRIIARAMVDGAQQYNRAPEVKTGTGFSGWWEETKALHGRKLFAGAMAAAIAVMVFDPVGKVAEHYIAPEPQVAQVEERYTVDGIPLLADISFMEEPDLEMEEVVAFNG